MPNVERFGTFYPTWPVIDGKPLNLQWNEIRLNTAETKAIVRNSFQELEDGSDELNAIRAFVGQAYGDLAFSKRYRFYYNKTTLEMCLQKNINTVASPTWSDVWCVRLADGQFQAVGTGGIQSSAGFYGPGLENIYQVGETGGTASSQESWLHVSKLFFNQDDGFALNRIASGANTGGIQVKYTFPVGRAEEFVKTGNEWTVNHNFGTTPVMVQVMDGDRRVVIPDLADVSDPNTAYFYFQASVSGSVYIATGGIGAVSLVPRDPFYLIVRHSGQSASSHLFHPNADLIFDSKYFYVNVDLDSVNAGAHKTAFVSLQTTSGTSVTALTGDRNIAIGGVATVPVVSLQPKLGGMEAFYFKDGSSLYQGTSIHVEVGGSDSLVVAAAAINIPAGSYTAPGVSFIGDTDSGLYRTGANAIALTVGGIIIPQLAVATTGIQIGPAGTAASPSISNSSSSTTGFFWDSSSIDDFLGIGVTGIEAARIGRDGIKVTNKVRAEAFYFNGGGNIYTDTTGGKIHFAAPGTDDFDTIQLSGYQLLVSDNNPATPAIASIYDTNTGLSWNDDDSLTVAAGGVYQMIVGRDGVIIKDKMEANAFYIGGGALNVFQVSHTGFLDDGAVNFEAPVSMNFNIGKGQSTPGIASPQPWRTQFSIERSGVRVQDKVVAGGFYLASGQDLGSRTIPIDIGALAVTNFFLDSFATQSYVIEDVMMMMSEGTAEVAFYITGSADRTPRGIGVVGVGQDGNSLGNFYVMSSTARRIIATSSNTVNLNDSLVMSVLSTSTLNSNPHLRGRVRIRLTA